MKVLVADDDAVTLRTLEVSLRRWGHEVIVAQDGLEAAQILEQPDAPKLLLLDWKMPGRSGVDLCRDIRGRKSETYTYILMLTAMQRKTDLVEALEGGADDFIRKPFDPQELRTRLLTGERILTLLDQLVAAKEAIREMSLHDGLTGLWNRRGILDILDRELNRARRQGSPLGLVMVDLDHFKAVNDTHGHLVGDDALRATGRTIQGSIRPYDFAGRYGGEEMLVVLPGCDEADAVNHAERLRVALTRISLPTSQGDLRISASLGVTVADHGASHDSIRLVAAADAALYRAKHLGRNRVEFAATAELVMA